MRRLALLLVPILLLSSALLGDEEPRTWELYKIRWGELEFETTEFQPKYQDYWQRQGVIREVESSTVAIQDLQDLLASFQERTLCGAPRVGFEVDLPPDVIREGDDLRMTTTARTQGLNYSTTARNPDFYIGIGVTVYGGIWFAEEGLQPLFIHSAYTKNPHAYDRGHTGIAITDVEVVNLASIRTGYEGKVAYLPYEDVPEWVDQEGTNENPRYFSWKYQFIPFGDDREQRTVEKKRMMDDGEAVFRYSWNFMGDNPPHDYMGVGPDRRVAAAWIELYYREVGEGYRIHGQVVDDWGRPLQEVKVYLTDGNLRFLGKVTSTDSEGRYSFDRLERKIDDIFDPDNDRVRVHIELTARRPPHELFSLRFRREIMSVGMYRRSVTMPRKPEAIEQNFVVTRPSGPFQSQNPVYARFLHHLGIMYYHTHEALRLGDLLGHKPDYGLPLLILTFTPPWDLAAWYGSSTAGRWVEEPLLIFGDPTTRWWDGGRPDNREWHEFAHHLSADALGNMLPDRPDVYNHAGYYVNPNSTDGWTEGLAEFLSMMVAKHVVGEAKPHLYRTWGWQLDLELDIRAWVPPDGGEELALAGVLLDLEDGPADYLVPPSKDLELLWWEVLDNGGSPLLYGRVRNNGKVDRMGVVVALRFLDEHRNEVHRTATMVHPRDLAGSRSQRFEAESRNEGYFIVPLAGLPPFDQVEPAVREVMDGDTAFDDDPVDLTLEQVWRTIIESRSSVQEYSAGWLFDIQDVYDAFRGRFGGADRNGNGVEDIDEIFVAHGFFGDQRGDRVYQAGERVGRTDHPGRFGNQDMFPRRILPKEPGSFLALSGRSPEGEPVKIQDVAVSIRFPGKLARHNLAFITRPESGDPSRLFIQLPAEETGAEVTLVALAEGREPSDAFVLTAADYWKGMANDPPDRVAEHVFELPRRPMLALATLWMSRHQRLLTITVTAVFGLLVLGWLARRIMRRKRA